MSGVLIMFLFLSLGGLLAGMLGGLLGIGGGILIMPILRFALDLDPTFAAGTCVVAVFFTALGGSLKHLKLGHINLSSVLPVIIPGLVSTLFFSTIFVYLTQKGAWLDVATGAIFSLVALRMLWEGIAEYLDKQVEPTHGNGLQGSTAAKMAIGIVAGGFPGLLGIGTGAVLVPAFAFALNAPIKTAIGSSLACFSLNALASSVFKISQGFVQTELLIPLCIGTLIGSRYGATLNGRFSSPLLKAFFGIVFFYVAYKYIAVLGRV